MSGMPIARHCWARLARQLRAKSRLVQRNRLREQMAGLLTRSLGKINQGSVEKCQVVHTLEKKVHLWS
jgi:hypothetical protein